MRSLYTIAVEMVMLNHASPVLGVIAHDLLGINRHLNAATAQANRFRTALVAAGTAFAAGGLLAGMGHLVDRGGEFLRITNQMRLQAWPQAQRTRAVDQSFTLSQRYPSVSATEILGITRELAPVLGDREEALHITENMVRLLRSLQMQFGPERAGEFHRQIRDAVRAGELSANVLQHERFEQFMNVMARSLNAFGGTLTPHDFMMAFRYSRAAGLNMSNRFVAEVLPTLMQEIGASGTGTSFMTAYQAVVGGRMRLRSLNSFLELGLVDQSKIRPDNLTPEGRIRQMQPGLLVGSRLYQTDPDRWVQEHLIPSFIRNGIITQEGYNAILAGDLRSPLGEQTRLAITERVALLFQDRTAQQIIDILALQVRKILRDSRLLREAYDLGRTEDVVSRDYTMARRAVGQQWENLNTALALPNMETAITGLNMLSGALGKLTDVVRRMNPSTVSTIMVGVATFAATFAAFAIVAVIGALVGWPLLLAGAIGAAVVAGLAALGTWLYMNWTWVRELAGKIGEALLAIPGMVADAIAGLASRIAATLRGEFSGAGVPFTAGRPALTPEAPGTPGTGDFMVPQNWVPPPRRENVVPIRHVLQIDGYKIGEAVSHYIAKAATHVQSAAQFDGGLSHCARRHGNLIQVA